MKQSIKRRLRISEVSEHIAKEISLKCWVETIRDQGGIIFLVLRDITGKVQGVIEKGSAAYKLATQITPESVVAVHGEVSETTHTASGLEIKITSLEILSLAEASLPIQVVEKSEEEASRSKRLDYRWIDLRKPEKALIFKVWTTMEAAFREACIEKGFLEIHSPKLMSSPSESKSELFEIPYFGRKAYLAQSPQFYKQMAQAAGFEGVFEVGPVFRANPSFTSRHDTEFTGYDIEFSFIESHHDLMDLEEEVFVKVLTKIKEAHGEEIEERYGVEVVIPERPFPRVSMSKAKEMLALIGIESIESGDLPPEEERALSKLIKEKMGHEFLFVTDYPTSVRPFYHMRHPEDQTLTKSFDLLWKGIEVTTGAQREHRHKKLVEQIKEKGLKVEALEHYLQFFRYGCPPHGGMGIGPSRMLTRIFELDNVREVTYLFRGPKRLTP